MSIGILIHNMILLLICLIFFRTVPVIAGVLIGAAAAEVLLISIARSTELCVESADGAYSSKKNGDPFADPQLVRGNTGVPFMEIYDDQPFSSRSRRTGLEDRSLCVSGTSETNRPYGLIFRLDG